MRDQLPAWIDIQKIAPGLSLDGRLVLSDLEDWPAGEASVTLHLDVAQASSGRLELHGRLQGESQMECQRCLQAMSVAWDAEFRLEVVSSEAQAQRLPDTVDAYIAEQGRVRLHELVREESILALPMMARHPEGSCQPPGAMSTE